MREFAHGYFLKLYEKNFGLRPRLDGMRFNSLSEDSK